MGGTLLAASAAWKTRLDVGTALAHPARAAIMETLHSRPGLTVGELARAWQVDYKTALHHARHLVGLRLVHAVPDGRFQRLFVAPVPGACGRFGAAVGAAATAAAMAAHSPPAPRAVLALQAVRSGASGPAELARALGVPRGTAGSLLDALSRRGLLVRDADGWRLSSEAERALAPATAAGGST